MNCTEYKEFASERVLSKLIGVNCQEFARALYKEKGREGRDIYLAETFGVSVFLHRKVMLINFQPGVQYDV